MLLLNRQDFHKRGDYTLTHVNQFKL